MKRLLPVIALALLSLTACKGSSNSVTPSVSPSPTAKASPSATALPDSTPIPTPKPTLNVVANGLNGFYDGKVYLNTTKSGDSNSGEASFNLTQSGSIFSGTFTFTTPGHTIQGNILGTEVNNLIEGTLTPKAGTSDCVMTLSQTSWIPDPTTNSATFISYFSSSQSNCPQDDGGTFAVTINQ